MKRLALLAPLLLLGCPPAGPARPQVVVYCALDRLYAQPVLERLEQELGLEILAKYDGEATKTTGLVAALRAEAAAPRADVFWNNELSQTVALAQDGLLAPYDSPAAEGLPEHARDPERRWTGFAARARVLIVNTELVGEDETPTSLAALTDPRWRGRCGIAKPLFGTTATQVAAHYARDPEGCVAWLDALRANDVVVCAGNADVKDRVAQGELCFGLTDTDDANLALLDGAPVKVVFPDQGPDGPGTLLIPNAVALLAHAPHPDAGKRLIDALLAPEVEVGLARSRSAQVPLRAHTERPAWIPEDLKVLAVDWVAAGAAFAAASEQVQAHLLGR
ncbi:MAG: extracellular solute-binding protein [Planctomycetota bacterium]